MKVLLAIITLLCPAIAIPEQLSDEWWQPWNFGAPCTTETDKIEGTCYLEVKTKVEWK